MKFFMASLSQKEPTGFIAFGLMACYGKKEVS